MPGLNGFEAATRIRQLSPESRIIILPENADQDLKTAALQAGAVAYVLKAEMTADLIPAYLLFRRLCGHRVRKPAI